MDRVCVSLSRARKNESVFFFYVVGKERINRWGRLVLFALLNGSLESPVGEKSAWITYSHEVPDRDRTLAEVEISSVNVTIVADCTASCHVETLRRPQKNTNKEDWNKEWSLCWLVHEGIRDVK